MPLSSNIEIVQLTNGATVLSPLVTATMRKLSALLSGGHEKRLAFCELVEKCYYQDYLFCCESTITVLKELNILQLDGEIHQQVRDIVLSSAVIDGSMLKLVDPVSHVDSVKHRSTNTANSYIR